MFNIKGALINSEGVFEMLKNKTEEIVKESVENNDDNILNVDILKNEVLSRLISEVGLTFDPATIKQIVDVVDKIFANMDNLTEFNDQDEKENENQDNNSNLNEEEINDEESELNQQEIKKRIDATDDNVNSDLDINAELNVEELMEELMPELKNIISKILNKVNSKFADTNIKVQLVSENPADDNQ